MTASSKLASCVAATLLALSPAALAPTAGQGARAPLPALAGRVLMANCRQGECSWLRVTRLERVRATPRGELRRVVGRRGRSVHGIPADPPAAYSRRVRVAWERADRSEYAFCSRTRPAYAFPEVDGYIVHYLNLFSVAGYQYPSATLYMHACHGVAMPGGAARLRRLGYRPGTRSEQVEGARPEDLTR